MSSQLSFPDKSDVNDVRFFAVGIGTDGHPHNAIIFRKPEHAGGNVEALELCVKGLCHGPAKDLVFEYMAWVVPDFDDVWLRALAAHAHNRIKRSPKIPFCFRYAPDEFGYSEDLELVLMGLNGFTCATYVLSFFDWLGIPILDYATWLPREDDATYRDFLLGIATRQITDTEHRTRLERERSAISFRPHEVAGASLNGNYPVPMPVACIEGVKVLNIMNEFYARVRP